jgi:hypothetical protein
MPPRPVEKGLAASVHGDVDIEKLPDVVFVERFERKGWEAGWRPGEPGQHFEIIGAEADAPFEPLQRNALKVTIAAGSNVGVDLQLPLKRLANGEPEELYLRYYLRLGNDWDPVDNGKLPGLAGTYGRAGWGGRAADGSNGWSARGGSFTPYGDTGVGQRRGAGSYIYHLDANQGGYGELVGWGQGPTSFLLKGRWYCIEEFVRLNRPGERDGVVRGWVDGQLAYERTDLRFRLVPDLRIETVWLNIYHGGKIPAAQRMTAYVDNLVVARRYIGPMAP